mmetsp:Transcript_28781/g.79034  ORF Transcript_28781/g.79034 Transcript_28781/m.79034 type:complete len:291 (+) Transcript_28781:356-1228(+)
MALYSRATYWDERYRNSPNENLDWYQSYRHLRNFFNPIGFAAAGKGNAMGKSSVNFVGNGNKHQQQKDMPPSATMETIPEQHESIHSFPSIHEARVLILGCGNSTFGEDMRNDGWTGPMVGIDFSSVVIEQQQDKYHHYSPKMEFVCHDLREGIPFPNESFDLIVAKATFDAILCGPSPHHAARRLVQEIVRCLAPGHGIFVLVSSASPDNRLLFLEHHNELYYYWNNVRHHAVNRGGLYKSKNGNKTDYVYICRKQESSDLAELTSSSSGSSEETSEVMSSYGGVHAQS